jgi:adenine-specific DNA-methyltransferase
VSATLRAVEELVTRVRAVARTDDPAAVRAALDRVLTEIGVVPGDPAWSDGRDVIGAAYERLVSGRTRRTLGQFFTPLAVGRAMARWLLADQPQLLLDPGCGSGSLLVAAAHERKVQTRLLGIDVDPLAIAMAEANRAARQIKGLELRTTDFLLDDVRERPQAVICNPPYTRHHALTAEAKAAIHAGFGTRLKVELSQLASLHVLFLVRALEITADEAALAFVTPAHWLDMNYAREIKRLLLARAHVEAIVRFPADELVFDHTVTTAMITLIRKGADGTQPTRLIEAKSTSTDSITAVLTDPDAGERVTLTSARKWSRPQRKRRNAGIALAEAAHVRRGVATGCNNFFVLSERQRRDLGLGRSSVRPCLASPRHFGGQTIDMEAFEALPETTRRWLLEPKRPHATGPLADYLARGRTEFGVLERHLVKQRVKAGRRWFAVEAHFEAPILFTYFNRPRARFVRNLALAVPLNNWLVITPHNDVDSDALFETLTSAPVLARLQDDCRLYGNGLWKLEPSELKQLRLPVDRLALVES